MQWMFLTELENSHVSRKIWDRFHSSWALLSLFTSFNTCITKFRISICRRRQEICNLCFYVLLSMKLDDVSVYIAIWWVKAKKWTIDCMKLHQSQCEACIINLKANFDKQCFIYFRFKIRDINMLRGNVLMVLTHVNQKQCCTLHLRNMGFRLRTIHYDQVFLLGVYISFFLIAFIEFVYSAMCSTAIKQIPATVLFHCCSGATILYAMVFYDWWQWLKLGHATQSLSIFWRHRHL